VSKLHELPDRRGSGISSEPPPLVARSPYRDSRPTQHSAAYGQSLTTPVHHIAHQIERGITGKGVRPDGTTPQPSAQVTARTSPKCPQLPKLMPHRRLDPNAPSWSAQPMAVDPSEYEKAMPIVAAHLAKIERAVDRTRTSHAGQPFAAVHQALVEALQDEGAQRVVPQVVEELARQISDQATEPWGAAG